MIRIFVMLAVLGSAARAGTIPFAGRLATSAGPVEGNVHLAFAIFDAPAGGTLAWSESYDSVNAEEGLVFAQLGAATPIGADVFAGDRWLEITVDGETLAPRIVFGMVPTAMHATIAERLGTLEAQDVQRRVANSCAVGSSIRSIDATGNVTCESDDNTTYTSGSGVTIAGSTISVTPCAANQVLKHNGSVWQCGTDATATYGAGDGLTVSNNTFSVASDVARKNTSAGSQNFDNGTLYLDYETHRVGVGTAAPQAMFHVNGSSRLGFAQAFNYTYVLPIATNQFVFPLELRAISGGGRFEADYIYLPSGSPTTHTYAGIVHLQRGATVTGIACSIYDNDPAADFTQVSFQLTPKFFPGSGAPDFFASGTTTGAPGFVSIAAPQQVAVQYQTNTLRLDLTIAQTVGSADLRFYGCMIDYIANGPD